MLLTLLGIAAAGAVGYNCVKDEEHREKTKKVVSKLGDSLANQAMKSGNQDCIDAAQKWYDSKSNGTDNNSDEDY